MSGAIVAAAGSPGFTGLDWGIVIGYLVFSTWLGAKMAGKQSTIRDFFLGGRKLPWYAVSGSIIATEISALTFVVVPFIVFRPGGNFTYLQLGIFGTFIARIIVGYWLVPEYYRREIYSPYDYMGHRMGEGVRSMTSALFTLGGILAQSARVYLTAEVLNVVLRDELAWITQNWGLNPLAWAIVLIGLVATVWTLIGGITTVIWTDVLLFLLFLIGSAAALGTICYAIPGGFAEIVRMGYSATESGTWGKFTFFDTESGWPEILTKPYTIWAGVIAATWGSLHPYGTDQLLVQRMFCCKGAKEARLAMISSIASQVVTLLVALVGVGLYAFYTQHPLSGEALELYKENNNRIFPIFIVYGNAIPVGLKGLIIAGVLAAAISSLTSILAALSQTVMSAFYQPWLRATGRAHMDLSEEADSSANAEANRHGVFMGRVFVLFWGVVLCAMAYLSQFVAKKYPSILDLGLAMAGYAGGALLAGFVLAFLRFNITGSGFMFSAPLSVLVVFAAVWHDPWAHWICYVAGGILLLAWIAQLLKKGVTNDRMIQTVWLVVGVALMLWFSHYGYWPAEDGQPQRTIAWPWYVPLGSTIAFIWGYILADPRESAMDGLVE